MTNNTIPNVPRKLKPCPFCGDIPSENSHALTDGGFKYGAIQCGCGALGPDVRTEYKDWPHWRDAAFAAWNERALLSAPSPAGVDGLEVVSNWVLFNAEADKPYIKKMLPEGFLAFFDCEEDARRAKANNPGTDYKRIDRVKAEDAKAIIDGLRGEVDKLMTTFVRVADHLHIDCEKAKSAPGKPSDVFIAAIDQQAQRIGEMEGLLRHAQKQVPTGSGLHMRIDAALSAVCAAAPNITPTSEHSGS